MSLPRMTINADVLTFDMEYLKKQGDYMLKITERDLDLDITKNNMIVLTRLAQGCGLNTTGKKKQELVDMINKFLITL